MCERECMHCCRHACGHVLLLCRTCASLSIVSLLAKRVKPLASAYAKISSALVIASGVISANEIDGDATSEEPKSSLASERPADGEGEASMRVRYRGCIVKTKAEVFYQDKRSVFCSEVGAQASRQAKALRR